MYILPFRTVHSAFSFTHSIFSLKMKGEEVGWQTLTDETGTWKISATFFPLKFTLKYTLWSDQVDSGINTQDNLLHLSGKHRACCGLNFVYSDNDWTSEASSTYSIAEINSVLVWRVPHEVSVNMMDVTFSQSCPINPVGILLWLLKQAEHNLYFFAACFICWIILVHWTDLEFCKADAKYHGLLTISFTFPTNSSQDIWLFQ